MLHVILVHPNLNWRHMRFDNQRVALTCRRQLVCQSCVCGGDWSIVGYVCITILANLRYWRRNEVGLGRSACRVALSRCPRIICAERAYQGAVVIYFWFAGATMHKAKATKKNKQLRCAAARRPSRQ